MPLRNNLSVRYNVRMNKFMTATAARKNFYKVIDQAEHRGFAITITHEGIPKVVVMSFEEYEGWQETIEIMSDPSLDADIQEGIREMKAGKVVDLATVKKRLKL